VPKNIRRSPVGWCVIWLLSALVSSVAATGQSPSAAAAQPAELVRTAITNELRSAESAAYFMWLDHVQKPSGSVAKQMVATSQGLIARTVAIGDKSLTPEQRQQEDERLNLLLNPARMREKAQRQKEDRQRLEKLFQVLPDALVYEYATTETTAKGHQIVELDFLPNPHFTPPSYEMLIFRGMKGHIWIDTTAMRIVRIEGALFKDITIGWGIVGSLERGGHVLLEQEEVTAGHWDITQLQLTVKGKLFLIKQFHIDMVEKDSDFRSIPKMNVQEAIELLRKSEQRVPQT